MATATLEIDQTILQILQAKATAQGVAPDVLLRRLLESENGTNNHTPPIHTEPAAPQLTPYQIATAKGLLGAVDSRIPNPDSPPIHTAFGQPLLAEHEKQGVMPSSSTNTAESAHKLTPYERAKHIIGSIDSSIPDSDPEAQPHQTLLGALVAEKLKAQGLKIA